MTIPLSVWQEQIRSEVAKITANPEKPYNLHFYEVRWKGKLRVFDLFRDDQAITIGESLIRDMTPIAPLFSPPVDCNVYVHVNYGGIISQDPDAVMATFVSRFSDTTVVGKLGEIQTHNQMMPVMKKVLTQLYAAVGIQVSFE